MAQSTSSTSTVTGTDGVIHTNQPVVIDNTVRATATTVTLTGSTDRSKYPAIQIDIVTSAVQYWIYDLGDEATRDADLALF